jgi:hypothetical protein
MTRIIKESAFGLAVTLVLFLTVEGILYISGVEPLHEQTDPFVGFASYSPLFVETRTADGEHVFATANAKFNVTRIPSGRRSKQAVGSNQRRRHQLRELPRRASHGGTRPPRT